MKLVYVCAVDSQRFDSIFGFLSNSPSLLTDFFFWTVCARPFTFVPQEFLTEVSFLLAALPSWHGSKLTKMCTSR